MQLKFTKMHGLGNDYVFLDYVRAGGVPDLDWPALARAVSPRHTAVGSDGLILMLPGGPGGAAACMRIFNADGSEGEMCGNGVRCMAFYLWHSGYVAEDRFTISTAAGPIGARIGADGGVTIGLGQPRFDTWRAPGAAGAVPLTLVTPEAELSCWPVSMGNPHAVVLGYPPALDWQAAGRAIAGDAHFADGTNVEFARVVAPDRIQVQVWERGSGATRACGTGAAAAAVVCRLLGLTVAGVTVSLPGGELQIRWSPGETVQLAGPVEIAFSGVLTVGGGPGAASSTIAI